MRSDQKNLRYYKYYAVCQTWSSQQVYERKSHKQHTVAVRAMTQETYVHMRACIILCGGAHLATAVPLRHHAQKWARWAIVQCSISSLAMDQRKQNKELFSLGPESVVHVDFIVCICTCWWGRCRTGGEVASCVRLVDCVNIRTALKLSRRF